MIDVLVVGGGVFGLAVALELSWAGRQVKLISAGPPGHFGSSAAETRIARLAYGDDALMTESALDGSRAWQALEKQLKTVLFRPTGVMHLIAEHEDASWEQASRRTLAGLGSPVDELDPSEIRSRYPFMSTAGLAGGLFEHDGGILLAQHATRSLHRYAQGNGVQMLTGHARPAAAGVRLGDEHLQARTMVWAVGAEVSQVFPDLGFIESRTQDSYFFPQSTERSCTGLPAWIDRSAPAYGVPDVGTGRKIVLDTDRRTDEHPAGHDRARLWQYIGTRFPSTDMTAARVETCSYATTPDEDFVIGQVPGERDHWILGGDSGHGYKHALTFGRQAAQVIQETTELNPRHSLGRFLPDSGGVR